MSPLTCTADQAVVLDAVETTMLADWSQHLAAGHSAAFVASLIEAAVHYDPRLGLAMDRCNRRGCDLLVDEDARDERGHLYCSDGCRDDDSHAAEQARHRQHVTRLAGDEHVAIDGQVWDPGYGWRRIVSTTFPNA